VPLRKDPLRAARTRLDEQVLPLAAHNAGHDAARVRVRRHGGDYTIKPPTERCERNVVRVGHDLNADRAYVPQDSE
jgi:hypothetical protein